MKLSQYITFLLLYLRNYYVGVFAFNFTCLDPRSRPSEESLKRLVVIGGYHEGGGLGNDLIFYPTIYFFAMLTGRIISILNDGIFYEICTLVECGFPFFGDLVDSFPNQLSTTDMKRAIGLKTFDILNHFNSGNPIDAKIVRVFGYMWKSNFWTPYPEAAGCISSITGCEMYDILCAESFALQAFIQGPFRLNSTAKEEKLSEWSKDFKSALLKLPHKDAHRINIGVHFRRQSSHFETLQNTSSQDNVEDTNRWLNSSESSRIFQSFEDKIVSHLNSLVNHSSEGVDRSVGVAADRPTIFIYIASDDELMKNKFIENLEKIFKSTFDNLFKLQILRLKIDLIVHTKSLHKLQAMTNNEGLFDTLMDWYCLSLSDQILSWRSSNAMVSTYVSSAARLAGPCITKSTNTSSDEIGNSTRAIVSSAVCRGTQGFDLKFHKGKPIWNRYFN